MMARSPSCISGWSAPHDPTRMKVGPVRDREDLRDHDLDVVGADPGRDHRDALAAVRAGGRGELAVSMLQLDRVEARRDPGGPVRVTGEEDVLGQLAWAESDVVLPFAGRDRDAAIPGVFDAGVRVRQDLSLAQVRCSAGAKLGRG